MRFHKTRAALIALLFVSGTASADFGVGVKAGTLGLGIEGRWDPLPWLDLRVGANQYDYDASGFQAGISYDATFALDTTYATANFRFPLSPFRLTAGAFSNGNELQMSSLDSGGASFNIGGRPFSATDVGTLQSIISFASTSPYAGFGYDFEFLGKFGLNVDVGLLWQGEPSVQLQADGIAAGLPAFQAALETERLEILGEVDNYKAWPVLSLAFVYNF